MIVKEVRGKDKLLVIHFSSEEGKGKHAEIKEEEITPDPNDIKLVVYDPSKEDKLYTGQEAVARADKLRGTGKGEYGLFGNNCEHFARYIKTDKKESKQVEDVTWYAKVGAGILAVGAVVVGAGAVVVGGALASKQTKSDENPPENPPENSASEPSNSEGEDNEPKEQ